MSSNHERAAERLDAAFEQETSILVEFSPQQLVTLRYVLDALFSSVRGGKVDEVKEFAGIENMIDAAHLIAIRKTLGD